MSKDLLEERQEREHHEAVAAALGISIDDLDKLDWTIEPHASDEGGYNIYFGKSSDRNVLAQIEGLNHGRWVRIGPDIFGPDV